MKVPISWLKEYIKIDLSATEIGEKLTEIGHMQDGPIKEIGDDQVLDLEVRQNRPDVLSIIGVARELGAVISASVEYPDSVTLPESKEGEIKISILDTENCYRFQSLIVKSITQLDLPSPIQNHLTGYGIPLLNPIVDITNFVMLEYGQPMHAFDLKKIEGDVTIRQAKNNEEFVALGGRKVILDPGDIVITDKVGVLALAGIIGGERAKVDSGTTEILLESAVYNQASVRRSSTRHGLRTEASTRLEKFLHPKGTEIALSRCLQLLLILLQGKIAFHIDLYPQEFPLSKQTLSVDELQRISGISIPEPEIESLLNRLELKTSKKESAVIEIEVPYFRTDLILEADLVEEVLRLYGYSNIPAILPERPSPKMIQSPYVDFEAKIRSILIGCSYSEQITEPLVHETESARLPIKLENSLTKTKDMLRTTLKHNLRSALRSWQKYGSDKVSLFEIGKIYFENDTQYTERRTLGLITMGDIASYFDLKGVVELVFNRLDRKPDDSIYVIEGVEPGVWYLELDLEALFEKEVVSRNKVLTKTPQLIFHDFSFIVSARQPVGEIIDSLKRADRLVYNVTLGETPQVIKEDRKSVFLHVTFHDAENSISNRDIEPIRQKLIKLLEDKFEAQVRLSNTN